MGIYLNPGNEMFRESVSSEIYIDKTGVIQHTNKVIGTTQKYVCVSRPRRFGKSITAGMLVAYYGKGCDSGDIFERFKIAGTENYKKHLNQYNVIALNVQSFTSLASSVEDMIALIQEELLDELKEAYPGVIPDRIKFLSMALEKVYAKKKEKFVFVIDEWDCVLRERKNDLEAQKKYLDFLRNLLKDRTYVALAYMTGILPVKKYGTHSALNMFEEFSMTEPRQYAEYVGFTEEEVRELCSKYQVDFELIKDWYDGYSFTNVPHVYNPRSVVTSVLSGNIGSYWTRTETYEALKVYLDMNYDGLKDSVIHMIGGDEVQIDTGTFQNDMTTFQSKDDILTLLVHLGYLAFDFEKKTVFIPNAEVREEFVRAINGSDWSSVAKAIRNSDKLLQATWSGDEEKVAAMLDEVHSENTSILTYNDENSLSCVLTIAYFSAMNEYVIEREFPSGKGFADLVFLPKRKSEKPAMIIELKYNKTADGAIAQIKDRRYTEKLKEYGDNLLLVGINYDDKKQHECIIEKM